MKTNCKAAIRELKKETGITNISFEWGKVLYETEMFRRHRKKFVIFWLKQIQKMQFLEKNPTSGLLEHEEYRWVTFEEAKELTVGRINKALEWVNSYLVKGYDINLKEKCMKFKKVLSYIKAKELMMNWFYCRFRFRK